jgi:DNA-binding response OmpR family regulator
MRLLLVEDDVQLGESLETALKQAGFAVDWEREGDHIAAQVTMSRYDAVVLDLGLPGKSGLEILAELRNSGNLTPVVILTARDTLQDKLTGFKTGADDYLTKPFEIEELLVRIRALIRRNSKVADLVIQCGPVKLAPDQRQAWLNDIEIDLTATELGLLEILMRNAGTFVSKHRIYESLYNWDKEVDTSVLHVYISRLRKLFGAEFIETLRGVGYRVRK